MTPDDHGKKLDTLLKGIRAEPVDPWEQGRPAGSDPLMWHLVYAFMAWEAGRECAVVANCRIHQAVVDYNEMRVCLPHELTALLGPQYPLARERALRLRTTLNDIYRREHQVTLAQLNTIGKREARMYLESLDGIPLFVAARLSLLSLDAHTFPLDERLRSALVAEEVVPPQLDVVEMTGWLERYFRAGEALPAYILLETWLSQRQAGCSQGDEKAPRRIQPS